MNIDRYMVNLFFEIKRNSPSPSKDDLKISDPDLAKSLIELHQQNISESLNRLIEVFFERAGDGWSDKLRDDSKSSFNLSTVARHGKALLKQAKATRPKSDKARYYRGALVK